MSSSISIGVPTQSTTDPQDRANPTTEETSSPTEVNTNREQDGGNESDSALGADVASSTVSLTESILEDYTLYDRTYQSFKGIEYWAPIDERQNEALDIFHNALILLLGDRLHLAPIGEIPKRVLDVGTGTGIWAIDFADMFPGAEVTATDISDIQPPLVPSNLRFELDDMNCDWTWPEDHFDFIHLRGLYGCVPDWAKMYKKAFHHLKPGGWMEHSEMDPRLGSNCTALLDKQTLDMWDKLFMDAGNKTGRRFDIAREHQMRAGMEAAGFVSVVEKQIKMPCGDWLGCYRKDSKLQRAGILIQLAVEQSLDGLATYLGTQILEWSIEKVMVLVAQMRGVVRRTQNYITKTIVYGRKPLSSFPALQ